MHRLDKERGCGVKKKGGKKKSTSENGKGKNSNNENITEILTVVLAVSLGEKLWNG